MNNDAKPWVIWTWNFAITPDEIEHQIQLLIQQGFGGIAIRPGRDMVPAYLSEEFFNFFEIALSNAQEQGVKIRLAEDLSLPFNGVLQSLTNRLKESRAQRLVLTEKQSINGKSIEIDVDNPDELIVITVKRKNDTFSLSDVRQQTAPKTKNRITVKSSGETDVLIFKKHFIHDSNFGYVPNVFNSKVAQWYIQNVLNNFKNRFTKYIPQTFEGWILEMPGLIPGNEGIPWDDDLVVKYRSKYKKDLIELLPILFMEVDPKYLKNRSHIYSYLFKSMTERFALPLESWGKKHRLSQWVLWAEQNPQENSRGEKGFLCLPGKSIAAVGIQNCEGSERNAALLRAVSDLNTIDFRRETITVLGRNRMSSAATLQDLKTEVDRALLNGQSKIVIDGCFFHLDQRSYCKTPFNQFWYTPQLSDLRSLCEYSTRINTLYSSTHASRYCAVFFPSSSILADFTPADSSAMDEAMERFYRTVTELRRLDIDFDIISEPLLSHCSIRANGEFGTADRIRKGNYQALIIPYSRYISKSTFVFIEKIAIKKGTAVFIDEPPQGNLDDGVNKVFTERIEKLLTRRPTIHLSTVDKLKDVLTNIEREITVTVNGQLCPDIVSSCNSSDKYDLYAVHNASALQDYFASITIPKHKYLYFMAPESGEIHEILTREETEESSQVSLNFTPLQTYILIGTSRKAFDQPSKGKKHVINTYGSKPRTYRVVLKDQWTFSADTFNAMPLSAWNTRIGLSRESRGYAHYSESYFQIRDMPSELYLCVMGHISHQLEEKSYEIAVNGNKIERIPWPEVHARIADEESETPNNADLIDKIPFGRNTVLYKLSATVIRGINRVTIRTTDTLSDPPTIVYPPCVLGNFSIAKGSRGWIIDSPQAPSGYESWTTRGFPYFSGIGVYQQVFEIPSSYKRIVLRVSRVSGSIEIAINENPLGIFNWQPMEFDITSYCESRRNQLNIRIVNTIDNILRMNGEPSGLLGEVYLDVYSEQPRAKHGAS
jgi:hypothetical protein